MEWNDETIARLTALWNEGVTTPEIARRMGTTKNAIVGKAHRLGLAPRPSPIKRDGVRKPRKSRAGVKQPSAAKRERGTGLLMGTTLQGLSLSASIAKVGPTSACCWPFGDPRTPQFRFCGEPATHRSYCEAHHIIAYVPMRRPELADAA